MTADTPAEMWWRSLTAETRAVWLIHITGWTLERAKAEAYARAMTDRDPAGTRAEGKDAP